MLSGEDVNLKYRLDLPNFEIKKIPIKMGDYKSIFDIYYDKDKLMWLNWLKT